MNEPADTVERVFDAYYARDPVALRALYAPTARTRRPGWPTEADVDELVASAEMDMVAFPDLRLTPLLSASDRYRRREGPRSRKTHGSQGCDGS